MRGSICRLAIKKAKQKRGDGGRFRLGACIAQGARVFSSGINTNKPAIKACPNSIHAEIAALHRAPKVDGGDIYVARVLADDTLALARPCPQCMEAIKEAGIDTIHYTNENGSWDSIEIVYERK